MDWTSDSEDHEIHDDFSWDSDEPVAVENPPVAGACRESVPPRGGAAVTPPDNGEAGPSRPSLITHFVGMGFSEKMVDKAIKENGEGDTEAILETLLAYTAIENSSSEHGDSPIHCSSSSENVDDDLYDMADFGAEEFIEDLSDKDRKLLMLVEMGFPIDEASSAIKRCGTDASVLELADSIHAAQMAEEPGGHLPVSPLSSSAEDEPLRSCKTDSHIGKKRRRPEEKMKHNRRRLQDRKYRVLDEEAAVMCQIPKPMIGFGLPNERMRIAHRKIPEAAIGPPYFYYENVALAPKGVWDDISRFLYEIEPEFVDSKYFCAAARKRGYIHNLPIDKRFPLRPMPPRTINEALPMTKRWWPSWDQRTQLNCLQTCIASAKLTERIRSALADCGDPPPSNIRSFILKECSKWNLVWVGLHKVAPLEPDEIEMLLGFPKDHTRGGGISRTERYRSLGNSFQVDTVAFHLSVLKDMFPNGITVLSLFSGIGGAEVALHRLGIHLKAVVSVEISEINRNIVRGWWEQTGQTGTLVDIADVQQLNGDTLAQMIHRFGGFDLVIGGSPCNNLAGSNRYTRDGLEGKQSSLFFDYFRILDLVKCNMRNNL